MGGSPCHALGAATTLWDPGAFNGGRRRTKCSKRGIPHAQHGPTRLQVLQGTLGKFSILSFLPLPFFPFGLLFPPSKPGSYTTYRTVSLTAAAAACMRTCMVTAFPKLDLAVFGTTSCTGKCRGKWHAAVPLEAPSPRAIYSPHVQQGVVVPICEADLPPRGTPGRLWGAGSARRVVEEEEGGCGCEVIGPRPSHREWIRDAAGLGFGVRGVVCG